MKLACYEIAYPKCSKKIGGQILTCTISHKERYWKGNSKFLRQGLPQFSSIYVKDQYEWKCV